MQNPNLLKDGEKSYLLNLPNHTAMTFRGLLCTLRRDWRMDVGIYRKLYAMIVWNVAEVMEREVNKGSKRILEAARGLDQEGDDSFEENFVFVFEYVPYNGTFAQLLRVVYVNDDGTPELYCTYGLALEKNPELEVPTARISKIMPIEMANIYDNVVSGRRPELQLREEIQRLVAEAADAVGGVGDAR